VEGTVIFNAVDGPDSGAVTGIEFSNSIIPRSKFLKAQALIPLVDPTP
ncbi:hypothetical protein Tco_1052435, partial [Tanacetum coccineum]